MEGDVFYILQDSCDTRIVYGDYGPEDNSVVYSLILIVEVCIKISLYLVKYGGRVCIIKECK